MVKHQYLTEVYNSAHYHCPPSGIILSTENHKKQDTMSQLSSRRDADFYSACVAAISRPDNRHRPLRKIIEEVGASPAPGYYVTYLHALRYCLKYSADGFRSRKRARIEMWREIQAKVEKRQARGMKRHEAISDVLCSSSASSFFLAPDTAWRLFRELRYRHYRKNNSKK